MQCADPVNQKQLFSEFAESSKHANISTARQDKILKQHEMRSERLKLKEARDFNKTHKLDEKREVLSGRSDSLIMGYLYLNKRNRNELENGQDIYVNIVKSFDIYIHGGFFKISA